MDQAKPAVKKDPELEWMHFYFNKGWSIQWRENVMYEFIRDKKLFDELLKYAKEKK